MQTTSRFFWISVLMLLSTGVLAQQQPESSPTRPAKQKLPKEKHSYKPTGVRLGTNALRLVRSAFEGGYHSYDFIGDIDFYRYILEVSYGRENFKQKREHFNYSSKGNFFRIGADANLISHPEKGNALTLGLKYVVGQYDENLNFISGNYANNEVNLSNNGIRVNWAEFNFGVKGKVISNVHAGFYVRFKVYKTATGEMSFDSYRIPGFGLGEFDNRIGFDYYLMWRIPFNKPIDLSEI